MKKILFASMMLLATLISVNVSATDTSRAGIKDALAKVRAGISATDPDNPKPVENVRISLSDDYRHVTLSWDPVSSVGESGGFVDVSKVTYYIFDAFGSFYDPAIAITTDTTITLDLGNVVKQDFIAYEITAGVDEIYYSLATRSDVVVVGAPYLLPFSESFANKSQNHQWIIDPESSSSNVDVKLYDDHTLGLYVDDSGNTVYLSSQDGDNGYLYLKASEQGGMIGIQSVKADLSQSSSPVLDLRYLGYAPCLEVLVSSNGQPFEVVKSIESDCSTWQLIRIDLSGYKSADYIRMALRLRNTQPSSSAVCIDNIHIHDLATPSLRIASAQYPRTIAMGDTLSLTAYIENSGLSTVSDAMLTFCQDDGITISAPIEPIPSDSIIPVHISLPIGATSAVDNSFALSVAIDGSTDTLYTLRSSYKVSFPAHPTVGALSGSAIADGASLHWTAPDYLSLTEAKVRTEKFENSAYPTLTISDFGGWTMYDVDGLKTYSFLKDVNNPYRTQPMAFQLFNPAAAGVPNEYLIDCKPHSGRQMLVAFSANGQNDNWLVSPVLSGDAQTISFWAKSFTSGYPESFEVYYSMGGTAISDFVRITEVTNYPENNQVPEDWTEFSASLPAGAKHFAIHHTSFDTYALMIDDITYKSAGTLPADTQLEGYNIYLVSVNGKAVACTGSINEAPITATTFSHRLDAPGIYGYAVSAVYNNGESKACAPVSIDYLSSSIHSVDASDDKLGAPIFYNLNGQRIAPNHRKGIYIRNHKKIIE